MRLDHLPEPAEIRVVWRAFVHHLGDAVGQRAIDDVGMPGDPADIGGTPENIVAAHIENIFAGGISAGEITAGGVENALGFPGGPGGVEDEQRVLRIKPRRGVLRGNGGGFLVPPNVGAGSHRDFVIAALEHDHALDFPILGDCLIDGGLERHHLAAPPTAIGGDDGHRAGIFQPIVNGLTGKPAEDHRVDRADPSAAEHRDSRLRHHRQIDDDPVAGLDAVAFQHIGKAANLRMEVGVGERAAVAGLAFPDDGGLVG